MVNAGQTLLELEKYLAPDVVVQGCSPRTHEAKAGAGNIRNSRQPGRIAGSRLHESLYQSSNCYWGSGNGSTDEVLTVQVLNSELRSPTSM